MKFKQPSSLKTLAFETVKNYVSKTIQQALESVVYGRTSDINITGLHEFIHGGLPVILSREMTTHIFSAFKITLENLPIFEATCHRIRGPLVIIAMKEVILAILSPHTITLDLSIIPFRIQVILTKNVYSTLNDSSTDSTQLLIPPVLRVLNCLVCFKMRDMCTDVIVVTLVSCCSKTIQQIHVQGSSSVTDESFNFLSKCHKLTHLSIAGTSMTGEGIVKYSQILQQYKNSDDKFKSFLHLSVGGCRWEISSNQLSEIAITCPMLRKLEITHLRGDMESLNIVTALEELAIHDSDIHTYNLNGFLRLRGHKLTSLNITCSRAFDDRISLINIMNNCKNLKEVRLFDWNIIDTELKDVDTAAEAFQSLEILKLEFCTYSFVWIEHVLQTCVNIKCLHLSFHGGKGFTDKLINRLLSRKALQKLTTFRAYSVDLSMRSANALIEQCPLLDTLGQLDGWYGMDQMEIDTLVQRIEENNQYLKIHKCLQ